MSLPTNPATIATITDGAKFTPVILSGVPVESVTLSWQALYVLLAVASRSSSTPRPV